MLYMCVLASVYIRLCVCARVHVICVHIIYVYVNVHPYMCAFMLVCVLCVSMHSYVCACAGMCIYMCVYVCVCACAF